MKCKNCDMPDEDNRGFCSNACRNAYPRRNEEIRRKALEEAMDLMSRKGQPGFVEATRDLMRVSRASLEASYDRLSRDMRLLLHELSVETGKRRRAEKHIAKREKEIRFMLRESAKDQGTIDRLKREMRDPCQRCEMRREQESRR